MKHRYSFTIAILVILLSGTTSLYSDEVYSKTEAANRLYKLGKYEEALKLYEDALLLSPSEDNLKINRGSALYRLGDLDGAEKSLNGALSTKDNKSLATAYYNLGNILFRKGDAKHQQGDQSARDEYKKALDHYIQSLDLQPSDYDAKWNLQLAHQRVKVLEQQSQQNKQNQEQKLPEPSENAKKINAEAKRLVEAKAYRQAFDLMKKLLETDKTAETFADFTKRLNDVADSQ